MFDIAAYAIYSVASGPGLVVAKAGLLGALAVLLVRLSRTGSGVLIPAICSGLAVLTLSIRVLVHPVTVSYLLFGLVLLGLSKSADRDQPRWLPPWPLALLFLLWANTDPGFVVGLGVVALLFFGRVIDQGAAGRRSAAVRAVATMGTIAGICVLNPAGFDAFSSLSRTWAGGGTGLRGVASPFGREYRDLIADSPAGLAYFPLLALSLLSFLLTARARYWGRLLPWAGLAALSAFQVRAVPYFAIVAGPVLSRNLEAFFAGTGAGAAPRWYRPQFAASLAALFGLAFLAAAWPGWLQGPPFEPRRWAVETPPALQAGAEAVCEWHAAGRLDPAGGGLHLSPDSAGAFAWFCPADRVVPDPDLVGESVGLRPARPDWADRMRAAGVTHVVVYETDRQRRAAALGRLLSDPDQWPLLLMRGGVTVFGWRDPARPVTPDPFAGSGLDLDRQALRPSPADMAPPSARSGPRSWSDAFWKPAPAPAPDRDAAATYLIQAEVLRRSALGRHLTAWRATEIAGAAAAAPGWSGPGGLVDADLRLAFFNPPVEPNVQPTPLGRLAVAATRQFVRQREDAPAAAMLLAVRACRRAIKADPEDARSHVTLGEAYLRLIHNSRERAWGQALPDLVNLRRAQAAAALERALVLDPKAVDAHLHLGGLYQDMGFSDLALEHKRAYLAEVRKTPGLPDEVRAAARAEQEHLDTVAAALADRTRGFEAEAPSLRVLDRAVRARDLGLVGRARDILLKSDISAFGAAGLAVELELLLQTGRPRDVINWTAPEHEEALGPPLHWARAQAFAAIGEYALAEEECVRFGSDPGDAAGGPRVAMASVVSQYVLNAETGLAHTGHTAWLAFGEKVFRVRLGQLVSVIQRQADARVLHGVLALEAGDTDVAATDFRTALATWGGPAAADDGAGIDFQGRPLAAGALDWIESADRRPPH